jgi:hypothetical protein
MEYSILGGKLSVPDGLDSTFTKPDINETVF